MHYLSVAGVLMLLFAPNDASAQDIVTADVEAPLRESPPGTFFQGKGQQIGTVVPGEQYRVLEQSEVPTIVGLQNWLKVEPTTEPGNSGWVYGGAFDDDRGNATVPP